MDILVDKKSHLYSNKLVIQFLFYIINIGFFSILVYSKLI